MSIIDRWKERRAEKKERQRHSTMIMRTIALVQMMHDTIWGEPIELSLSSEVEAIHITMKLITDKDPGPDEEVCQRMLSFVDNVVANESISLKEIRDVFDGMMDRIINCKYQYEMILALMRTEPMFRL